MGGALGDDGTGTRTTDVVLQCKTVFKPLKPNNLGLGLPDALGVRHHRWGKNCHHSLPLPEYFSSSRATGITEST